MHVDQLVCKHFDLPQITSFRCGQNRLPDLNFASFFVFGQPPLTELMRIKLDIGQLVYVGSRNFRIAAASRRLTGSHGTQMVFHRVFQCLTQQSF